MKHLVTIICAALACAAQAAAPVATTEGKLKDGTPYRIDMPEHWNGAVLVGLDYASRPPGADAQALLAEGYAMAGTTRTVTGWALHRAAANAVETLDVLETKYGKAALPIQFGQSQGGHIGAVSMQAYPQRWRGAMIRCGGLSGAVGQWQGKLDGLFVAKVLLAPDAKLPVTGIPADWETGTWPAWIAMFEAAEKTPEGRARIAFAARVAQLPEWSDPRQPEPAPGDAEARARGLADSLVRGLLRQGMGSRRQLESLSGGNVSANTGVDYGALLAAVDGDGLVRGLYRKAGIALDQDLAALARAPRLAADPKALAFVSTSVFDGDLAMPVLTMNALGDAISPPASQQAYEQAAGRAGKRALLRQTYTHSAGHCAFTPAESVAGVHALAERIRSGKWPDTSAKGMTALAGATGLGPVHFVDYTPPPFLRPYEACTLLGTLKASGTPPFGLPGQALPRCIAAQPAATD
jgi:pimeloyl-ACP methyl ester carboxylesterase